MENRKEQTLLVGKNTSPIALKTSIVGILTDFSGSIIYLDCIGVAANYIATKAMIMAQGDLSMRGKEMKISPIFKDFEITVPNDSKIKTGVRWVISELII